MCPNLQHRKLVGGLSEWEGRRKGVPAREEKGRDMDTREGVEGEEHPERKRGGGNSGFRSRNGTEGITDGTKWHGKGSTALREKGVKGTQGRLRR